jgi:membrane protease YdiL (CAAX protease family)
MVEISHVVADLVPALARPADEEAALRETMRIHSIYSAIAVPLALVVLAPVTEELLFRAFAQRELVDRLGPGLGVGLVAVLFAVFHMDPASAPTDRPSWIVQSKESRTLMQWWQTLIFNLIHSPILTLGASVGLLDWIPKRNLDVMRWSKR